MSSSLNLTEDQVLIQDMAQRFTQDKIAPFAAEWDEKHHFPVDMMREAATLGFGAIYTPDTIYGSGLSRMDAVLIFEQLSQACPSSAAFMSIHNMVTWMVASFGSASLHKRYSEKLASMEFIGSYCLTEPSAGSDAANLKTKAIKEGEGYRLTGTKQFISGAGVSDIYIIMARTSDEGAKGISAFLVEKDSDGLSFGANEKKMGWKCQPTRQVIMDNVLVSADNMIGQVGDGFKIAMNGLNGGRLNIAACSLGGADSALQQSVNYVKDREQFGKPLAHLQNTQFKLADMSINLQASRLMLYDAASKLDSNVQSKIEACAMAKCFVTDKCFEIVNQALQLHGGYGYLSEYNIERILRDLRVHQILEGTNEIMRLITSRSLLN